MFTVLRTQRKTRLLAGVVAGALLAGPLVLAAPASATTALGSGSRLASGAALVNGPYKLAMQSDGNLVEYNGTTVVWNSGTEGQPGNYLAMQSDGNMVVYSAAGAWRWQTATNSHPGARMQLQSDGNVVVYSTSNAPLWAQTWRQSSSGAQAYAFASFVRYGWGTDQQSSLVSLWNRESGWRWNADNSSSGAYGIPQSLPASKMSAYGPDWQTNGETQVAWGLNYIYQVYGSPANAWAHEVNYGWY